MWTRWAYNFPEVIREMSRLSRDVDRWFGDSESWFRCGVFPQINLYDKGEELLVRAELPGVDPKEVELSATGNSLTISGQRKKPVVDDRAVFHRKERNYGAFRRALTLPQEVDATKTRATFTHGILEIVLPKAEIAKPRKIAIQA